MNLYPLKFTNIHKPKIWGSEDWVLSAYADDLSVVVNGYLADNDINDLVEVYMGELVGDKVYERFGNQFPLLCKFIHAEDDLSIQVHPDDEYAQKKHGENGKTEMWYVITSSENARLVMGFKKDCDRDTFLQHLDENTLPEILNFLSVKAGDATFITPGIVHAICKGTQVAEIQQTSDLTYRIYDYNRRDAQGNPRELHLDKALDVIDFKAMKQPLIHADAKQNAAANLVSCPYFTSNVLNFNREIARDYAPLDSFVIFMCIAGSGTIKTEDGDADFKPGETILIPASINDVTLLPISSEVQLLEIYIDD